MWLGPHAIAVKIVSCQESSVALSPHSRIRQHQTSLTPAVERSAVWLGPHAIAGKIARKAVWPYPHALAFASTGPHTPAVER